MENPLSNGITVLICYKYDITNSDDAQPLVLSQSFCYKFIQRFFIWEKVDYRYIPIKTDPSKQLFEKHVRICLQAIQGINASLNLGP